MNYAYSYASSYTTRDELNFLAWLYNRNQEAFANYTHTVLTGMRRYDDKVSVVEVKAAIQRLRDYVGKAA